MKRKYNRKARNPFVGVDPIPVGKFPYRLLVGGRGAERTLKGQLLPTGMLRVAGRVSSLGVASAIARRLTDGRISKLKLRKLEWDRDTSCWFLVIDF